VTQPRFAITSVHHDGRARECSPVAQTTSGVYAGTIDFNSFVPPLVAMSWSPSRAFDENGTQTVVARHFRQRQHGAFHWRDGACQRRMIGSVITIKARWTIRLAWTRLVVALVATAIQISRSRWPAGDRGWMCTRPSLTPTNFPPTPFFPTISFRHGCPGNESTHQHELSLDNTRPPSIWIPQTCRR